jgi:hypothetical protein
MGSSAPVHCSVRAAGRATIVHAARRLSSRFLRDGRDARPSWLGAADRPVGAIRMFVLRILLLITLSGVLIACAPARAPLPQSATPPDPALPPERAVATMLQVLHTRTPGFIFPHAPTEVRGQRLRLGPALTLISHGTPSGGPALDPAREVWLFVVRGDGSMSSPPVPNATTPDIAIAQVAIILDAVTGERIMTSAYPPSHESSTAPSRPHTRASNHVSKAIATPVAGRTLGAAPRLQRATRHPQLLTQPFHSPASARSTLPQVLLMARRCQ